MDECIFCKIVKGEIPSKREFEDEKVLVIDDINPAAEVHKLIFPKVHIESIDLISEKDKEILYQMFVIAKELARKKTLTGYRLVINGGNFQEVPHLHLHLLGGKLTSWAKKRLAYDRE